VFESPERLRGEIGRLMGVIRRLGDGRYACLLEPGGILFEDDDGGEGVADVRRLIQESREEIFRLPAAMAAGGPPRDVFGGREEDGFLLAFVNARVALIVATPEAEGLDERARRPLRALVDRLLRWRSAYRMDASGRGFFFGAPRLDVVVVAPERASSAPHPKDR
jgi:hypothetical protein